MAKINENYLNLKGSYLFSEISRRISEFTKANPGIDIIRLGIGDVTQPLVPAVIQAMHHAVDELASEKSFKGYGPEQGHSFLIQKIVEHDYRARGISLDESEVFVSDGAKCDTGNFQELFSTDSIVAVADPVYPVYVDTNVMAGRGSKANESGHYAGILYLPCREENELLPDFPKTRVDLIYLCFPNNPTGTTITKGELAKWVEYARRNKSIILYDSAYEAYIQEPGIPHSIYEVEGAREVAVEFRSYSKTAGFTGVRCAYTVVPKELKGYDGNGNAVSINELWKRRQTTKFNGASYPVQVAAAATYTPEGKEQIRKMVAFYMENARIIRENLVSFGLRVYGGKNAPYIWLKTPGNLNSWDFFNKLLNEANIVGTPGVGFGPQGEGFFRLTAFGSRQRTIEAMERFKTRLKL